LVGVASERLGSRARSPLGRFFDTFDEAWADFLAREEPLESFFDTLPDDRAATLDVWLIEPSGEVKAAAAEIQRAFAQLGWIEPTPPHFLLHVTIGHGTGADPPVRAPFEVAYRRVNCFHEAVIVEVESAGEVERLQQRTPSLPHLTIGYVREPGPPGELREALEPLRDADLGRQRVEELVLCRVPASRWTFLQPWTVLRRLQLER
jgi:2'-5' RNA ligase